MEEQRKKGGCCGAILVALLIISLAIVGLAAYGEEHVLGQIDRVDGTESTLSQEQIDALENETEDRPDGFTVLDGSEIMDGQPAELIETDDRILNVLLIGQDRRAGEGRTRSDTMILCTINTRKNTLVMTSFLRDLYVDIPDWNGRSYQDNRLNVCYAFGGMGMLDLALKNNFGVVVDHNIEVDFGQFQDIIELFGGVEIELTQAEAAHLGGGLKEGKNLLTPKQALNYARIRKLDSDFGRTDRQRKVLTALLEDLGSLEPNRMTAVVNKMLPLLTTDMTNADMTHYMIDVLPLLPKMEITTQYIPAAGTYKNAYVRGMAVLVPDLEANREILKNTLN